MHATFDYAGCRHAVANAGASDRIADAPSAMSPAPCSVRDVELAAPKHVRPVQPRKQLGLEEPHAAAGNAGVERGARRHLAATGELREHDFCISNRERTGTATLLCALHRLYLLCWGQICDPHCAPCF